MNLPSLCKFPLCSLIQTHDLLKISPGGLEYSVKFFYHSLTVTLISCSSVQLLISPYHSQLCSRRHLLGFLDCDPMRAQSSPQPRSHGEPSVRFTAAVFVKPPLFCSSALHNSDTSVAQNSDHCLISLVKLLFHLYHSS